MNGKKQYTFKIVTTGPESSGKTVMAQALAAHYNTNWAPEFARYYLAQLGRSYVKKDLQAIGRGQQAWESWYARQQNPLLICDTDWTVLQIWEKYKYGSSEAWHKGFQQAQAANLYLLCAPDFRWQPDLLREHPTEREVLFQEYENLLQARQLPYLKLYGPHQQRLQTAISMIDKLFGPL